MNLGFQLYVTLLLACWSLFAMGKPVYGNSLSSHAASQDQSAAATRHASAADTIGIRSGITVRAIVIGGDTIPYIELKPVNFFAPRIFANRWQAQRYERLVYNVKKVYPYARLAGIKLREYNDELAAMKTESERRRAVRQIEKDIRAEFEADLMRLTRTQGMILIKLIDRETRFTSYDLLKDFRGMVSAVFWQSLGRIFGYNLKTNYDPYGEDSLIEEIVLMIEAGIL